MYNCHVTAFASTPNGIEVFVVNYDRIYLNDGSKIMQIDNNYFSYITAIAISNDAKTIVAAANHVTGYRLSDLANSTLYLWYADATTHVNQGWNLIDYAGRNLYSVAWFFEGDERYDQLPRDVGGLNFEFFIEEISMIPEGFGRTNHLFTDIIFGGDSKCVWSTAVGTLENNKKGCPIFHSNSDQKSSVFPVFESDENYPVVFAANTKHFSFIVCSKNDIHIYWSKAIDNSFDWRSLVINIAIEIGAALIGFVSGGVGYVAIKAAQFAMYAIRMARAIAAAVRTVSVVQKGIQAARMIRPLGSVLKTTARAPKLGTQAATKAKSFVSTFKETMKTAGQSQKAKQEAITNYIKASKEQVDNILDSQLADLAIGIGLEKTEEALQARFNAMRDIQTMLAEASGDHAGYRTYQTPDGGEIQMFTLDPQTQANEYTEFNRSRLAQIGSNAVDVTKAIRTFTDGIVEEFVDESSSMDAFYRSLITVPPQPQMEQYSNYHSLTNYDHNMNRFATTTDIGAENVRGYRGPVLPPKPKRRDPSRKNYTEDVIEEFSGKCNDNVVDSEFYLYATSQRSQPMNFNSNNITISDIRKVCASKDDEMNIAYIQSANEVYLVYATDEGGKKYNLSSILKSTDTLIDIACSHDGLNVYIISATPSLIHIRLTNVNIKDKHGGYIAKATPIPETFIYALPVE